MPSFLFRIVINFYRALGLVVLVSRGRAVLRLGALFRNSSGEYVGAARAATLLVRNRQPTS
jgi:hypothetical protein